MKTQWKVDRWSEGYIVVDKDGYAEPTADFHTTRAAAKAEADTMNASYAAWNARGLADAPHLDNW